MLSGYINGYLKNRGQLDIVATQPALKKASGFQTSTSFGTGSPIQDGEESTTASRNQRLMLNIVKGAQQLETDQISKLDE